MTTTRRLTAFAALAASIAFGAATGSAGADTTDWQNKVSDSVLAAAAAGETEFMVYMGEQADLSAAAALGTKKAKGEFVYAQLTDLAERSQAGLRAQLTELGVDHRSFWIVNTVYVKAGIGVLQAVASRPDVDMVYPVGKGRLELPVESTTDVEGATGVDAVGPSIMHVRANQAWSQLGVRGQGAVVAGADTGYQWTHNALKGKYRGWDGTTGTVSHDYNWHDGVGFGCPAKTDQGRQAAPCDDHGHGTHTMGTMVGDDGGANQVGMAPEAKWIGCRNMDEGFGVVPTYMDCMQWFLAPTDVAGDNPDPTKAPDVVNNSWGCVEGCAAPLLKAQVDASRAAGIFYAVSAGNDGPGCATVTTPLAVYDASFTVGATGATSDAIAYFSSRGPVLTNALEGVLIKPDIVAPGQGIRSATIGANNNTYGSSSGTSMAGPHVAGLVALLISANPSLRGDVDRLEEIIRNTAKRLFPSLSSPLGLPCPVAETAPFPNNVYGYGRIDAFAAVAYALAPIAVDDTAATEEEAPVTIALLANDSDPSGDALKLKSVSDPAGGTAVANADGTVTYTPDAGFAGTDTFEYVVSDDKGNTDTGLVTVTVDAGQIAGGCGELDDGSAVYSGGWDVYSAASALGGTYHRRGGSSKKTSPSAPTATLSFTGDRLVYRYGTSSVGGTADVLIDGVVRGSISYASGEGGAEAPTFGRTVRYDVGPGSHTFVLRHKLGAVYVDGFAFDCPSG